MDTQPESQQPNFESGDQAMDALRALMSEDMSTETMGQIEAFAQQRADEESDQQLRHLGESRNIPAWIDPPVV